MTTRTTATGVAGLRNSYGEQSDDGDAVEPGDSTVRHFTIDHDGVTIPVSRGGRGRPLVLCPGLNSTQADLHELAGLLRRDHDVVTFDLRGHGLASAADEYSFEAFLSDLTAVMAELEQLSRGRVPVLVGYSLGADLAVHYARRHPGAVAELVLVDGANPVPEPFITEAVLPAFRAMWEDQAAQQEAMRGSARQVLLTAQEIADRNVEIDTVRSEILDQYSTIDCRISMIMSTSMAGEGDEGPTQHFNQIWRAGVERLVREQPHIATYWIDADHRLVFTHALDIARVIRSTRGPFGCIASSAP